MPRRVLPLLAVLAVLVALLLSSGSSGPPTHPPAVRLPVALQSAAVTYSLATPDNVSGFGGWSPQALWSAYRIPALTTPTTGTVAIVDAYDAPSIAYDMSHYRARFHLPACTVASGCFTKVDEWGGHDYPAQNAGWAVESSLDVEMVSALCPRCHIVLVEAAASDLLNLYQAEEEAASLKPTAISLSWGSPEPTQVYTCPPASYIYGCVGTRDALLDMAISFYHPGIATVVSAGDDGYGASLPADSPWVIAVGGTSLRKARNTRGWQEQAWSGSGSGCSLIAYKPPWQNDRQCADRTISDVAFDADPWTGVAVFDSTPYYSHRHKQWKRGWTVVGGTSVGAPAIAALYGLANNVHWMPRGPGAFLYAHAGHLFDVASGTNAPYMRGYHARAYLIQAQPGYDAPTGNGSPDGLGAF